VVSALAVSDFRSTGEHAAKISTSRRNETPFSCSYPFNRTISRLRIAEILCASLGHDHIFLKTDVAVIANCQPGLEWYRSCPASRFLIGGVAIFLPQWTKQCAAVVGNASELVTERVVDIQDNQNR
jgi:hypothetical protein